MEVRTSKAYTLILRLVCRIFKSDRPISASRRNRALPPSRIEGNAPSEKEFLSRQKMKQEVWANSSFHLLKEPHQELSECG
ncbi:hypothetical protein JTE90_006109 [Oedothorax gibbosus]|uniref:Uncharacterized protein n=1 Tax=Oedothorax gibbosus TaxID=931172 RepID=A0AAV6V3S0_9ARAC|nr:hypothetical protein JTE90_006109 [Oedothorax gibbosus]